MCRFGELCEVRACCLLKVLSKLWLLFLVLSNIGVCSAEINNSHQIKIEFYFDGFILLN